MNVYVIYRFSDFDYVEERIKSIESKTKSITFFRFNPNISNKFWHRRASKKIKESNMVIFFDKFQNNPNENYANVKWELKCAEKYKKRIIVFKENSEQIDSYPSKIYSTDYSDNFPNKFKYKIIPIDNMVNFLVEQVNWNVEKNLIKNKLNDKRELTDEDKQLLLEQYKIMIDTSEKLMERRQSTGNLYTTICSALIAFVGTSLDYGSHLISSLICIFSGIIIIMLCLNWRSSLKSYELNNAGKFEVINEIERFLPAEMFECEYRYNTFNGIRSYSTRERTLPFLFMLFGFVLTLIPIIVYIIAKIGLITL